MHFRRRRVFIIVLLVKFLESVIMKLKFNMILATTCLTNCIIPNKTWFQFLKHLYGYLHMEITFLKFLEQCNFCHFYNVLSMFHTLTFIYVMSYDMLSIWNRTEISLPKLHQKCFDSSCKHIFVGFPSDKSPIRRFIIFIHSNPKFHMIVQRFSRYMDQF